MLIKPTPKILEIYQNAGGREPIIEWLEAIKDIVIKARIKNMFSMCVVIVMMQSTVCTQT